MKSKSKSKYKQKTYTFEKKHCKYRRLQIKLVKL